MGPGNVAEDLLCLMARMLLKVMEADNLSLKHESAGILDSYHFQKRFVVLFSNK